MTSSLVRDERGERVSSLMGGLCSATPLRTRLSAPKNCERNVPPIDPAVAEEAYCYLTTTGRVSGEPREIEIWFGLDGATVYLLSGGGDRSNWVRNLQRDPAVTVRIAGTTWPGRARILEEVNAGESN